MTAPTSYAYQWNINGTAIAGANTNTYTPAAGDVGEALNCTVTGINSVASASVSSATTALVQDSVPTVPTVVTTSAVTATNATLNWNMPLSNGGSTITGYVVTRNGVDSGGYGAYSTTLVATANSFPFNQLISGDTYTFTVAAINAVGIGPAASISVTISGGIGAPSVPTLVSVSGITSTTATINWSAPISAGGSTITGYVVTRNGFDSGGYGAYSDTLAATANSFTFNQLISGDTYTFTVAAINASGTGTAVAQTVPISAAPGGGGGGPTSTSIAPGFAKGMVWQDYPNLYAIDTTINPGNPAISAVINKDAADMQTVGVTQVRYWPATANASYIAGIFQIFENYGIGGLLCYNCQSDASSGTEATVISQLNSIVPACAAIGMHYYEIGNEMNLASSPWTTSNPVGQYCTRLRDCYTTIKSLDPAAIVIAGGISYNPSYTADGSTTSDSWFSQFCSTSNAMWNYCDGLAIHPYSDNGPSGVTAALSDTRNAIASASGGSNFAAKPLVITELGWYWQPSSYFSNGQHGGSSSEANRDSNFTQSMDLIKANGIDGGTWPVSYYDWYDGSSNTGYGVTSWNGPTARTYSALFGTIQNYSTPAIVAGTPPTVPLSVATSSLTSSSVVLSWAAPFSAGTSPVTGYTVGRNGVDSGGYGVFSTTLAATATSVTFNQLIPGDVYALTVAAVSASGTGPAATVSVTIPPTGDIYTG
jgi:hypothetical protein